MAAGWVTVAEIGDALARFERNLGWERPTLHGVGFAEGTDEISFVRVNDHEHLLAAAVLATVTGWRGATGSVRLGKNKLANAIERLAPAEACPEIEQPNLRIWREIHRWSWDRDYVRGGQLIAVFDADPDAPTDDPYVIALRQVVASGRQAVPADGIHTWPPPGSSSHALHASWQARWPQVVPISHLLKEENDRWVRFHSLPGSKRYADTPAEYATILHRHNTVLDELGAHTGNLHVITVEVAFTPVPRPRHPVLDVLLPDAECWTVLSWPDLDPVLAFAHAYVNRISWQPGRLDGLLRGVADDEMAHLIIAAYDLAWLYGAVRRRRGRPAGHPGPAQQPARPASTVAVGAPQRTVAANLRLPGSCRTRTRPADASSSR
jgi:hypothetical protein